MPDSSDPYTYPGTDVLRNTLDIRDPQQLAAFEANATTARLIELDAAPIEGRLDIAHLKAIHRHIFQDVYAWAGEFRTVNISKSGHLFGVAAFVEPALHAVLRSLPGDLPVYELVVAKGGPKMKETKVPEDAQPIAQDSGPPPLVPDKDGVMELAPGRPGTALTGQRSTGLRRISARMETVAAVIPAIEASLGHAVLDKTGLTATYDFNLDYRPDTPGWAIGPVAAPRRPPATWLPRTPPSIPRRL